MSHTRLVPPVRHATQRVVPWLAVCAAIVAPLLAAPATARAFDFHRIADTNTPIPAGTGNFTGFDPASVPGPQSGFVTFRGFGANGQEGIYNGNQPSAITRIADRNTLMPIPGGPVTFQSFTAPSGGAFGPVFFQASGGGTSGIFRAAGTTLTAVDTGSAASFQFGRASATGDAVAYLRNGVVHSNYAGALGPVSFAAPPGVVLQSFGHPDVGDFALGGPGGVPLGVRANYTENGQPRSGVLYDTSTTAPEILFPAASGATGDASVNWSGAVAAVQNGGQTLSWRSFFPMDQMLAPPAGFNQFDAVAAGSPNLGSFDTEAVFSVSGSAGEAIYYFGRPPGMAPRVNRVIGTGDLLDGRTVQGVDIGRDSEVGLILSFHATFTDGSSGIYSVTLIPEPSSAALLAAALLVPSRRRRRRR